MRGLVVYESMFGNTRTIARAVGEGLAATMTVEVEELGDVWSGLPGDLDLLVVGGPTHAHGMTSPQTRADAARRAREGLVSRRGGIREWLESLAPPPGAMAAAAFDTRLTGPELLWGSAAKDASKRLAALGFRIVAPPLSILIGGPTGSMFDRVTTGELDRARRWGTSLAMSIGSGVGVRAG